MSLTSSALRSDAYDLRGSQVSTPPAIVAFFWELFKTNRPNPGTVIDLGAGDGRFSIGSNYSSYVGIEIDERKKPLPNLPPATVIHYGCAFEHESRSYDACIGNPPYVRHHYIEPQWREHTIDFISRELGCFLDRRCNLYVYFMCLGLVKTTHDGIVAFIVPYEWVSRPSARPLRDVIIKNRWPVKVYRFVSEVFPGVLTTASISIIDKSAASSAWEHFDVGADFTIRKRIGITGTNTPKLSYDSRGEIWAMRGLSPGSQTVFTLTEKQRRAARLNLSSVHPCITSLKPVSKVTAVLTKSVFEREYVMKEKKCWLIKTSGPINDRLNRYLSGVEQSVKQNHTCKHRKTWYKYPDHPIPRLVVSSGFTKWGPKVLVNEVGVVPVGAVYGIHSKSRMKPFALRRKLVQINFEARVVPHAGSLKKIEPRQLNAILKVLTQKNESS